MTKISNKWIYAVYKGEEFITEGTRDELCKELEIKRATFNFYRSRWYKKNRETKINNRRIIVRIDGKDKVWNGK